MTQLSPIIGLLVWTTIFAWMPSSVIAQDAKIRELLLEPRYPTIADRIRVYVSSTFNNLGNIREDTVGYGIDHNLIAVDLFYVETDAEAIERQSDGVDSWMGELDEGDYTITAKLFLLPFGQEEYVLMDSVDVDFSVVVMGDWVAQIIDLRAEPESPITSDSLTLSAEAEFPLAGHELDSVVCHLDGSIIGLDIYYLEYEVLWPEFESLSAYYALGQLRAGDYSVETRLFVLRYGNVEYTLTDTAELEFSVRDGNLRLATGWNLISYNYEPNEHNVPTLFADLADSLVILKNGLGQFYVPSLNFNNIRCWEPLEGYAVKMAGEGVLRIIGTPIPPDTVIHLRRGWNLVAYLPDDTLAAADGFRNIEDVLFLAKDGEGRFYWPARGYDDLILRPGGGYLVYVTEAVDFVWNVP